MFGLRREETQPTIPNPKRNYVLVEISKGLEERKDAVKEAFKSINDETSFSFSGVVYNNFRYAHFNDMLIDFAKVDDEEVSQKLKDSYQKGLQLHNRNVENLQLFASDLDLECSDKDIEQYMRLRWTVYASRDHVNWIFKLYEEFENKFYFGRYPKRELTPFL